jgi:CheY-like chemotaxis protein
MMHYDIQTGVMEQKNAVACVPDKPYILVVDDDHAILSVVMLLLETEGYISMGFSDSQKVLPFLKELHATGQRLPSVVLLDLMMPVVSGYDITAFMATNEWTQHLPVVIMTADHRVTSVHSVPGASDWISKPFRVEVLLNKLEAFIPAPCVQ